MSRMHSIDAEGIISFRIDDVRSRRTRPVYGGQICIVDAELEVAYSEGLFGCEDLQNRPRIVRVFFDREIGSSDWSTGWKACRS
jgi:hypothetical protein